MHLNVISAKFQPFCSGPNVLRFLVPEYLMKLAQPWLLMPWPLASPGHQQPWYWPCSITRSLSIMRTDYNKLHPLSIVWNDRKCKHILTSPTIFSVWQGLKNNAGQHLKSAIFLCSHDLYLGGVYWWQTRRWDRLPCLRHSDWFTGGLRQTHPLPLSQQHREVPPGTERCVYHWMCGSGNYRGYWHWLWWYVLLVMDILTSTGGRFGAFSCLIRWWKGLS